MRESGKTKLEFSKELGIPRSTLQGYLKGEKCLRSDSIEELAKSLHISSAQLIAGPEYTGAFKPFSMCALLAELQVLQPQAQALARRLLLCWMQRFGSQRNGSALMRSQQHLSKRIRLMRSRHHLCMRIRMLHTVTSSMRSTGLGGYHMLTDC